MPLKITLLVQTSSDKPSDVSSEGWCKDAAQAIEHSAKYLEALLAHPFTATVEILPE